MGSYGQGGDGLERVGGVEAGDGVETVGSGSATTGDSPDPELGVKATCSGLWNVMCPFTQSTDRL